MAQTPARDFIQDAAVDVRFYTGSDRNHANNGTALAWTGAPIIQPAHGVPALCYCDGGAAQTWMVADQTDVTFEFLISMDMLHLGTGASAASTVLLCSGSWQIGLAFTPGAGFAYVPSLWCAFNGAAFGDTYFIEQPLWAAAGTVSTLKGGLLHVVLSASYVAATSLTVTTLVNGTYSTATTLDHTNHNMDATPTNVLLDLADGIACPVYLLRMWERYEDDALVLADLYRAAQRILPGLTGAAADASELAFVAPA